MTHVNIRYSFSVPINLQTKLLEWMKGHDHAATDQELVELLALTAMQDGLSTVATFLATISDEEKVTIDYTWGELSGTVQADKHDLH